ncbi:hypothetical protein WDU94_004361 [Cyamophila willieti]
MTSMASMNLVHMPYLVLEKIFSFLSYDEISKTRLVCVTFNDIGSQCLNRGFYAAETFHKKLLKNVKSLLPRRESERRTHPLSKKSDILQAVETRLSMLSMTFSKYIESQACCFIPGKVIDEIFRVLKVVNTLSDITEKGHEFLQELRDISSMAMEHFDEKIVPGLKMKLDAKKRAEFPASLQGAQMLRHHSVFHSLYLKTNREIGFLRKRVQGQNDRIRNLVKANALFKKKTKKYVLMFKRSQDQLRGLMKSVSKLQRQSETSSKGLKSLDEEKQRITDMVKRVETCETKITELLTEPPALGNFETEHFDLKCTSEDSMLRNEQLLSCTDTAEPSRKRQRVETEDKM